MHVLVLDPNPTVRCALEALFASEPHMSATVGEDLDALSGRGRFDVALVDERIAGAIGERERATLDGLLRAAPVVVMGMGEPESYARVHIAAGAAGYWPKDGDIDALVALVRAAAAARRALSGEPARRAA